MTKRRIDMGVVTLVRDDYDDYMEWYFEIEHNFKSTTFGGRFDTPGQALDAAMKWAKDRNIEMNPEFEKFNLYRIEDINDSES